MLAKPYRLRRASDITRVYKRGVYGAGGPVAVKAVPTQRPESRATIVVGKKVSKLATVRNRIRRRVSGVLEQLWPELRPGHDMVITVYADVSELPAERLAAQVRQALKRAQVLDGQEASDAQSRNVL